MIKLKDKILFDLSQKYNVARFVSFGPNLDVRFSTEGSLFQFGKIQLPDVVDKFLGSCGSLNIRTFTLSSPNGNPFIYGVTDRLKAIEYVLHFAEQGYYTILNETISVHDGGVSGVVDRTVVEFSPDDTPRAVEKEGICALPYQVASRVLSTVYGLTQPLPIEDGQRIEFSVHPRKVGCRNEQILIWEFSPSVLGKTPTIIPSWPNNFSKLLGDKIFGLLVADSYGIPVPFGTVVGRRVAPFSFGTHTNSKETWIRTAPIVQQPGRFTTTSEWVDPYELMQLEDPTNSMIQALIFQEGILARYSGATLPGNQGVIIEGVMGKGDDFMAGTASPNSLPQNIYNDVKDIAALAETAIGCPVRIEWVHDGIRPWVVQLHVIPEALSILKKNDFSTVNQWVIFNPIHGISELVETIKNVNPVTTGIKISGSIGITSHIGDLLRKNKITFVIEPF